MDSLADQFLKAGLISSEQHEKVSAEQDAKQRTAEGQRLASLRSKSNRPANFDRLETCKTVNEFKDTARKILLEYPEEIGQIIQSAHRFQEEAGGRRLVWLMYSVRDGLAEISLENREQFIKRAFRKSGGTIQIPKDKLP